MGKEKAEVKNKIINNPNILVIADEVEVELKSTKLRYFKDGSFNAYALIQNIGINQMMLYDDGTDLIRNFLIAIFDDCKKKEIDGEIKEVKGEFIDSIFDDLTIDDINRLIAKAKEVNGIKDEDFSLATLQEKELP